MSNRETKTVTLKSGKEVVLYSWITARQARDIREVVLRFAKFGFDTESTKEGLTQKPVMKEYDAANSLREMDESSIRAAVLSFDGSSENIIDRLLDGPDGDWTEVLALADEVTKNPGGPK